MQLYDYFRSSASFRVRIALNLKGLSYDQISVHLVKDGGQHLQAQYEGINPQKLVPCFVDQDSDVPLAQSLAIIEYLEEQYPTPALLPTDPIARAEIRAFAQHIACEIHPLNNLRVLNYLTQNLQLSQEQKKSWYHHWLSEGFNALEKILTKRPKMPFCFGNLPTLADICLIPQVYNAVRFEFPLEDYPLINAINKRCLNESAFSKALPENQPDA
ncbi:MAG: maleylacetoacetate isomerase [Candidatus Berkiella sp.]